MLLVPIQTQNHANDAVIIVLDQNSIDRMAKFDPAEILLSQTGKKLVSPKILICFEKDEAALSKFIHKADIKGLIKYLQRGWKFHPELGDHDRGPESISGQN